MNFELSRDESDFLESLRAEGQATSGSCSSCGGKGSWLNTDGKAVLCSCLKEQMWRDKYITAGVPPKYFGKTLSENWNLKQDPWGNNLTQAALAKKIKIKSVMDKYINALPALCAGRPIKIIPNRGTTINLLSLLLVGGQWSGKSLICSALAQEEAYSCIL